MSTIDLGDVVGLAVNTTDASGIAANATLVTLTITRPDGTTAGPYTVAPSSTGHYAYDFPTAMAGRHTARWVGTGTNASVYTDVFDVWETDPRFLISLDDTRTTLNFENLTISNDEELRLYIAAATPMVEDVVGPVLSRVVLAEQHTPRGAGLALHKYPVLSVQSVTEYPSGTVLPEAVTPAATGGFTVDKASGVLTRRGAEWADEAWVSYTTGRTLIAPNWRLATAWIVQHQWRSSQQTVGRGPGRGQEQMVATPSGYMIPHRAMTALSPDAQPGGFA